MILLLSVFIILSVSCVNAASTVYVNINGSNSGNGSIDNPYKTISQGINATDPNGILHIANGVYSGENNTNLTINKNMHIIGQSQSKTIINGNGTNWIFKVDPNVKFTIQKLTLTNATNSNGGAIYNEGTLTANSCTFTGNSATNGDGGAIYNSNGILNIVNSIFANNTAGNGGAICNIGSLIIESSNFTSNTATNNVTGTGGGAIYNLGGAIKINDSKFIKNAATGNAGGAIFNQNGTTININKSQFIQNGSHNGGGSIRNNHRETAIIINNCNFTLGNAEYGGAICSSGILIIINSNFTQNSVTNAGGAISNVNGTATIINSTFTNNIGKQKGGAIYSYIGILTVISSTFENNNAPNGETLHNSGANATISFSRIINNGLNEIYNANNSGYVDARYNWWGSNSNPSKKVNAGVNVDPWLVLTISPNPNTIKTGKTSIITVDLQHDSNGVYHNPNKGHVPSGITIKFTETHGTLNPASITLVNGSATATFTASNAGMAVITATADNQTISTHIKINTHPKFNNKTNFSNKNTIKAADTITIQKTGLPLNYLLLALLMVINGLIIPKRK